VALAGLDFTVELADLYQQPNGVPGKVVIPEWRGTRRSDTNDILGVVKRTYAPIQNIDGFSFLSVVTESGEVIIDSGGAVRNGAINWIYCRVPQNVTLLGDDAEQITMGFLTTNGHDGKRALRVQPLLLRVRTGTLLSGRGFGNSFSLRHAGTMEGKVAEARTALGITFKGMQSFEQVAGRMAKVQLTTDDHEAMLRRLFPAKDEDDVPRQTQERREAVKAILYGSPALEGYRGTGMAFYFAVCEYADYFAPYIKSFRSTAAENRLLSITQGDSFRLKDRAMGLVLAR
jgi:phage/plasmid-like protein (TIGR03299 family)